MGGRGASSGISVKENKYGSQYESIFTVGNIKFVKKKTRESETLMETMTKGRVYVTIGGKEIKSITYFDKNNKRNKVIDIDHYHKKIKPHTHKGYEHNEYLNNKKGASKLSIKEKKMVERVTKEWYNYINK